MPGDRVAKGLQERREGAIEVVAVTASPGDDSLDRLGRVNAGRPSELDIDVLVRNHPTWARCSANNASTDGSPG
jgi:hypothetical protein